MAGEASSGTAAIASTMDEDPSLGWGITCFNLA